MMAGVVGAINAMGLKVPQEISVVGVGDTELVKYNSPPISTVRWDMELSGRNAAQLMLQRLKGAGEGGDRAREFQRIEIPTDFVLRDSCAALASATEAQ